MVADLKVGPRSRRSSASSRKSGDSDVTNLIDNEAPSYPKLTLPPINIRKGKKTLEYRGKFRDAAVDKMKESWNLETLDEIIARLRSLEDHDITRLYNGLSVKHRERKAQRKGKKAVVQTRTESFQTAIDGEDTTPHHRGEMRKAPKTLVTAGRMRCHLLFMDISPLPQPQQPRHSLIEIYHTAAAEVTEKVDNTARASNAAIVVSVIQTRIFCSAEGVMRRDRRSSGARTQGSNRG
ncbi:hypothetical protein FNYG_14007 [Fusarium nygamai]|uniref:Uncharacterized protein n=1 Tax=Gibberella nygamai TaxID=42673 RepID=A0A2K0UU81_GIBNY|nr:hypothetical protein FNYG_14007 [Fusarium nygamai]